MFPGRTRTFGLHLLFCLLQASIGLGFTLCGLETLTQQDISGGGSQMWSQSLQERTLMAAALYSYNFKEVGGGSLIIFLPFCREWGAEQQGVCCHHEAAPDARLGEAQGHGLHTAHEGHVEVCPGDSVGLHSSQAAVAGLGRSNPIPWISQWHQALESPGCLSQQGFVSPSYKSTLVVFACCQLLNIPLSQE